MEELYLENGEMLTSRGIFDLKQNKEWKQLIRFSLHPNIFTPPKNWEFYFFEFISDGYNGRIPILKSKYKSSSKKIYMLKCL